MRTITGFLTLDGSLSTDEIAAKINKLSAYLDQTKQDLQEKHGFEVQTLRLSLNSIEEWMSLDDGSEMEIIGQQREKLKTIHDVAVKNGIGFVNLGPIRSQQYFTYIPWLLNTFEAFNCSLDLTQVGSRGQSFEGDHEASSSVAFERAKKAAEVIHDISLFKQQATGVSEQPLNNFKFCVSAGIAPGCPFYPASYSFSSAEAVRTQQLETDKTEQSVSISGSTRPVGYMGFSIGLENGTLLSKAYQEALHDFSKNRSENSAGFLESFQQGFVQMYRNDLMEIDAVCVGVEKSTKDQTESDKLSAEPACEYIGIDTSLNPSIECSPEESMGAVLSKLLQKQVTGSKYHHFGDRGSTALCFLLTEGIRQASMRSEDQRIRTCGYCGLMLPTLEDHGLAVSTQLTIDKLLQYSTVCGVGLDTIPIPGLVEESRGYQVDRLAYLLMDLSAISLKFQGWNSASTERAAGKKSKPLSCRVLPCIGKHPGDKTNFNSPYLVNSSVFYL